MPPAPNNDDAQQAPPPKRNRRLWQFSLRTLLVSVIALAVWLAIWVNHARRQKQAIDHVQMLSGSVQYAHQFPTGHWDELARNDSAEPPGPAWLRNWLGDEYFVCPVGLNFMGQPIDDDDMVQVGALTDLERLWIVGGPPGTKKIAGFGLTHLRNLTALRDLALCQLPISDEDIMSLERLTRLEGLLLSDTLVTDAGLRYLKRLKKLSYLSLSRTQISAAGLEELKGLTELTTLDIQNTKVTDLRLRHLTTLRNLSVLWLDRTQISDESLQHLQDLPNLQVLGLADTKVTGSGLQHLMPLNKLARLRLDASQLTSEGLECLKKIPSLTALDIWGDPNTTDTTMPQKALPKCRIIVYAPDYRFGSDSSWRPD